MDTLNEPIPGYGPALIRAYEQERDALPVYTPGSGKALRFLEAQQGEIIPPYDPVENNIKEIAFRIARKRKKTLDALAAGEIGSDEG